MKLTDEKVAKALGWTYDGTWSYPWKRPTTTQRQFRPPHFTTSLDAIVAEVEARGLEWGVCNGGSTGGTAAVGKPGAPLPSNALGETPALALCAALLAFLKETR